MMEHQWKELSKYFLDNGNRKLSKEEKNWDSPKNKRMEYKMALKRE